MKYYKKIVAFSFAALLLVCITSCGKPNIGEPEESSKQTESSSASTTTEFSPGCAFGFASDDNRIMISEDYPKPEELTVAYGNYGETLVVKYMGLQEDNEENNHRYTSYNFNNLRGHIYKVLSGQTQANDGYFLTSEDYFKDYEGKPMYQIIKMTPGNNTPNQYGKVPTKDITKMELRRGRKVIGSGLIAQGKNDERLEVFQFEKVDGEMLYSLVFIKGDKIFIDDYYTDDGWRVDDGGDAIEGIGYDLIFIAENAWGDFKIGVSQWAPEGCVQMLFDTAHGRLQPIQEYTISRYTAPV